MLAHVMMMGLLLRTLSNIKIPNQLSHILSNNRQKRNSFSLLKIPKFAEHGSVCLILASGRQKQEDQGFKASLDYIASSRPTSATVVRCCFKMPRGRKRSKFAVCVLATDTFFPV